VGGEHGQMLLAQPGQQGGHKADAHASADVAHQGTEAADIVVFLLRDADVTEGADGDEEERQS
jgi:hypothetical protein